MLTFRNFCAWIEIDGTEAKEYETQTIQDSGNGVPSVTCWIGSESGKNFAVNYKDTNATTTVVTRVYVDGQPADSGKLQRPSSSGLTTTTHGFRASQDEIKSFVFGDIRLTDDDQYLQTSISPDLGTISLTVQGCVELYPSRSHLPRPTFDASDGLIHERAKKGVMHHVRAGASIPSQASVPVEVEWGVHIVKFVFKYRTIDQLIANDIVPRPAPKRSAPLAEDDVIELSSGSEDGHLADEETKLKARLAAIREQRARKKVKQEPKVKAEADVKPRFLPGEVIDLSE